VENNSRQRRISVIKNGRIVLLFAALLIAGVIVGTARPKWPGSLAASANSNALAESNPQTTTGPSPPSTTPPASKETYAEDYTKKLLLVMDRDKSGRVSKKEFMDFMSREFDRLDTDHDGQLDVKELAKWEQHPYVGK
jgi:hypothetical protein